MRPPFLDASVTIDQCAPFCFVFGPYVIHHYIDQYCILNYFKHSNSGWHYARDPNALGVQCQIIMVRSGELFERAGFLHELLL